LIYKKDDKWSFFWRILYPYILRKFDSMYFSYLSRCFVSWLYPKYSEICLCKTAQRR